MDDNFSPRVKDVIAFSKEEALRLGHDFIGTEHLMLGLLRDGNGKAMTILNALDVDLNHLRRKVEILSPANPSQGTNTNDKKDTHEKQFRSRSRQRPSLRHGRNVCSGTSAIFLHTLLGNQGWPGFFVIFLNTLLKNQVWVGFSHTTYTHFREIKGFVIFLHTKCNENQRFPCILCVFIQNQ